MVGRILLLGVVALVLALLVAASSDAHLAYKARNDTLTERWRVQSLNLRHARYVCRQGDGKHQAWACKATGWIGRELAQTQRAITARQHRAYVNSARARTIAAAEIIRARGGNPWPNCPDPNDGASWDATKACESPGYGWHEDPPGYFCGPLQFDPHYWWHLIMRFNIPC